MHAPIAPHISFGPHEVAVQDAKQCPERQTWPVGHVTSSEHSIPASTGGSGNTGGSPGHAV